MVHVTSKKKKKIENTNQELDYKRSERNTVILQKQKKHKFQTKQ
jgi:hypothetical protein